jgi:hypothetical protein
MTLMVRNAERTSPDDARIAGRTMKARLSPVAILRDDRFAVSSG